MRRYLPTLLFLAACVASPQPTYERGVYRPAPPTFRPHEQAPYTEGQPGHLRPMPEVQPGPKPSRVLPQTPETRRTDGIWASNAPNLSDTVYVMYEPMPAPNADDERWANERTHLMQCGWAMNANVRNIRDEAWIASLNEKVRACLAYKLMMGCLGMRESMYRARGPTPDRIPGAASASTLLAAGEKAACVDPYNGLAGRELNQLQVGGLRYD